MKILRNLWDTICLILDGLTRNGCCPSPVDEDVYTCCRHGKREDCVSSEEAHNDTMLELLEEDTYDH